MFTAIPAILMLVTTLAALVYQTYGFITKEPPNIMLAAVTIILILLAIILTYIAIKNIAAALKNR